MENQHTSYLSLGSNLEDKKNHLQNAVKAINSTIGEVTKISSIYETPAFGFDGDDFYNICIELKTNLSPFELIDSLLTLELDLGRIRKDTKGYQNRVIDIDIILYESLIVNTEKLVLPHPRALERNFVLYPLIEIAEKLTFPTSKNTLSTYTESITKPKTLHKTKISL
jgi:2-amino-4-hydroxy-6-hydroxymethyldihydropteridine diphosphokinase